MSERVRYGPKRMWFAEPEDNLAAHILIRAVEDVQGVNMRYPQTDKRGSRDRWVARLREDALEWFAESDWAETLLAWAASTLDLEEIDGEKLAELLQ